LQGRGVTAQEGGGSVCQEEQGGCGEGAAVEEVDVGQRQGIILDTLGDQHAVGNANPVHSKGRLDSPEQVQPICGSCM
jgi:hypothetical protein